jgi:hypothetical protein
MEARQTRGLGVRRKRSRFARRALGPSAAKGMPPQDDEGDDGEL